MVIKTVAMSNSIFYPFLIFSTYICLSVHHISTKPCFTVEPLVNTNLQTYLIQIIRANTIQFGQLISDKKTLDISEQFLNTIADKYDQIFLRQLAMLSKPRIYLPHKNYQPDNQPFANSNTIWIFIFVADFISGPDLIESAIDDLPRSLHHISVVLVVCEYKVQQTHVGQYLSSIWKMITPRDLIALLCNKNDCISYRFNPHEGLKTSNSTLENSIYSPMHYAPENSMDRDLFTVKLFANHVATFSIIDAGDAYRIRLVGIYMWIAQLFAELFSKRLHVIVLEVQLLLDKKTNFTSMYNHVERIVSHSLLPMDRFEVEMTYLHSIPEYIK